TSTLSLHDALPILRKLYKVADIVVCIAGRNPVGACQRCAPPNLVILKTEALACIENRRDPARIIILILNRRPPLQSQRSDSARPIIAISNRPLAGGLREDLLIIIK